jgi:hypothetical protein
MDEGNEEDMDGGGRVGEGEQGMERRVVPQVPGGATVAALSFYQPIFPPTPGPSPALLPIPSPWMLRTEHSVGCGQP